MKALIIAFLFFFIASNIINAQDCAEIPKKGLINLDDILESKLNVSNCIYNVNGVNMTLFGFNDKKLCTPPTNDFSFRVFSVIIKQKDLSKAFHFDGDFPIDSVYIEMPEIGCGTPPINMLYYNDGRTLLNYKKEFGIGDWQNLDSIAIGEIECGLIRGRLFEAPPIIITFTPFRNNSKWGTIYDLDFDENAQTLVKKPIENQEIKIYKEQNELLASSITNDKGVFNFCSDIKGNYELSVNIDGFQLNTFISKNNENCKIGECEIVLPISLLKKIKEEALNNLKSFDLTFPISEIRSINIPAYQLEALQTFLDNSKKMKGDNLELKKKIEGMGRLLISLKTLNRYANQTTGLNDVQVKAWSELIYFILSSILTIDNIENYYNRCDLCKELYPFDANIFKNSILNYARDVIERSYGKNEILKEIYSALFKNVLEFSSTAIISQEISPFISDINISNYYISKGTQPLLTEAISNATQFSQSEGFSDAFATVMNKIEASEMETNAKVSSSQSALKVADYSGKAGEILDLGSKISALAPMAKQFELALKALAYLAKATEFSFLATSIYLSESRLLELPKEASEGVSIVFQNRILARDEFSPFKTDRQVLNDLELSINEYNSTLINTIDLFESKKTKEAFLSYANLIEYEIKLQNLVKEATRAFLAVTKQVNNNINNSLLIDRLKNTFETSPLNRLGILFFILGQSSSLSDDINEIRNFSEDVIKSNNKIIDEIKSTSEFFEGLPTPAYICISKNEIPAFIANGSKQNARFKVRNYGKTVAPKFYVVFKIDSPFHVLSNDSILIDDLKPNQEKNIDLVISNSGDENASSIYTISFIGEKIISFPEVGKIESKIISSIQGSQVKTSKNFEINVSPNPNNGAFNLKLEGYSGTKKLKIRIVSIDGKIIVNREMDIYKNFEVIQFNLDFLPQGMYWIEVQSDAKNAIISKAIIKQ